MMDTPIPNTAEQGDDSAASAIVSLGRTLREARERLGLSVPEVADQTKLAARQIEALEADDFQHLPEMTFVRGFVRSYAKILHLDAQTLLLLLPQANPVPQQRAKTLVEVPFPTAQTAQRINLVWLGVSLLLAVLIVAFVVWQYTRPATGSAPAKVETALELPAEVQINGAPQPEASVAVPAVPAAPAQPALPAAAKPAVAKVAPVPPTAPVVSMASKSAPVAVPVSPAAQSAQPDTGKPSALRLVFGEESWTEIRNRDDKIISSQVNPPGSELKLDGRAPFSLVIGHAASVHLYRRDKQIDLTPYINSSSEVARLTVE